MNLSLTDWYFRAYVYIIAFVFGAVMGSFLNCCAYRICHNMSIVKGRSMCDHCGHVLGVLDLVPIFSYLFSGGKCRYCGSKLSIRYFFSEVIGGLTYLFIVIKFGLSLECLKYLVLCSLLLCASFADLEDMIIPDRLIVLGLINRLVFVFVEGNIKEGLISSLIGMFCISIPMLIIVLIMERIMKREAMGGGDLKLFMMIGSYFSIGENVLSVLFACVIGLLFSLVTRRTKEEFPFGPSICLAYFLTLFVGCNILNWYFSLF